GFLPSFFFSSRRRHTRFSRDWSSDVCSSDLNVLLGAPGAPLIVSGETSGTRWFYLAFTLERSNLPVSVSYPIIGARMVGALASSDEIPDAVTVGSRLPVTPDAVAVVDPRGNRARISLSDSAPVADVSGFWTVENADGSQT